MHRVHHSVKTPETNSNFGFNLPWWDRLLGTYLDQPGDGHESMTIGLNHFQEPSKQSLHWLLALPFVGQLMTLLSDLDDLGYQVEQSLKGRVHSDQVNLVPEIVKIAEKGHELSHPRAVEQTDLAEVNADASWTCSGHRAGLAGDGLSTVTVEIPVGGE